ncbi:MAG: hypothetical protein ABI540_01310 [Spartobacteria bacterium]
MKKLVAVLVVALVVAAAVWVIVRIQLARQVVAVPELLPEQTLVLVEIQDFQRTRTRWHESDLYKIWREPAIQAWLQKPFAGLSQHGGGRKALEEFLQLGPEHGFLALTSLENNEPKLVGGFHFEQSTEATSKFIEEREATLLSRGGNTRRETALYQQHKIETVTAGRFVFARVYDNQWCFVSNDLAVLKALLDRVDHRKDKNGSSLRENAVFSTAMQRLPREYAGMIYLDPRPFVQKLLPLIAMTGQSMPLHQLQRLQQVRGVAAAVGFEQGKMRETDFVAMPQMGPEQKLKRTALGIAGTNTFLYSAGRVRWSDDLLAPAAPATVGLPALVQQFTSAMSNRGIAPKDLREALGDELEIIGDWPAEAHWPSLVATLPVQDLARARKIAEALTSVDIAGAAWARSDENGATVYSAQPFGALVPVRPAVAVSDKMMLAGTDVGAVTAALARFQQPADELSKSAIFQEASAKVPAAESAFNYVDTRLLYERADAAARPLLLMGATFYPDLGKRVDISKLPPPDVIAKHLSPIVMSQHYDQDGYVTESVGPVTFREATLGVAGGVGGLFIYLQEGLKNSQFLQNALSPPDPVTPAPSVSPTPIPSPF